MGLLCGTKSAAIAARSRPANAARQEDAYDLVYRHGLDVDASGDRLAMGSTTGGLWLSEDQGVPGIACRSTCR